MSAKESHKIRKKDLITKWKGPETRMVTLIVLGWSGGADAVGAQDLQQRPHRHRHHGGGGEETGGDGCAVVAAKQKKKKPRPDVSGDDGRSSVWFPLASP